MISTSTNLTSNDSNLPKYLPMKPTSTRFGLLLTLALVCMGLVSLVPASSSAQSKPTKVVVLNVPGGGSEKLSKAIAEIDDVEIEGQTWFLEQIQGRGFKPKGIMKRPDDIKWLMKGAEINYILFLAGDSDTAYTARVVGPETGGVVHTFPVDRTPDGISDAGARMVQQEFSSFLVEQREPEEPVKKQPEIAQLDEEDDDPNAVKKQAAASDQAAKDAFSKDWLIASVRGNAIRRDLHVAGANEAVLSYTSVFYPGFSIDLEMFPIGQSNPDYAAVGFYANYTQGFDSVNVLDDEGEESPVAIGHLELEGGVLYQLGDALALKTSNDARFHLSIGLRHASYSAADNPSLPSVSHTAFVLGTQVTRQAFSEKFMIRAGASVSPIGGYGTGATLFGESSHTYGFGGNIGGMLQASEDIGITLGYEFGLQRTVFTGEGEAQFIDANAFELVQGVTGGLFYQY
jgi:hypothetical protein